MAIESQITICNKAIGRIGSSMFIQDINEGSQESIICAQFYDSAVQRCLEDGDWNFASRYVALQDIGSPPLDWLYRYRYPNDCAAAREILLPSNVDGYDWFRSRCRFRFEVVEDEANGAKAIVTNLQTVTLRYTALIQNPALFTAAFVNAVAYLLASDIAAPLSAEPKYAQQAAQAYQLAVSKALALNYNEGSNPREEESEFLKARW